MFQKLVWLLLVSAPLVFPQGNSLPGRETLYYNLEWRLITAGKARVEWLQARSGWQVNLHLESVGLVSKLFKVQDDYSANLSQGLCVESSQLSAQEGSRQRATRIGFDYGSRKANYVERDLVRNTVLAQHETEIPACVHDVAGGLFFLRTLNLEPGQSTMVPVSDGKKSVMAKVEAQQREDVKVPDGTFHTVRYEVYLFNDVLYRRPAHLDVWLTDDRRKLPVQIRVRMQFTIGTITMLLAKHE
jgi:hypothetical protein